MQPIRGLMMPSVRTRCLCTTFAMATVFHCATPRRLKRLRRVRSIPQTSRAFAGLFQDTVTDFRNLASKDTLTMLAVGGLMAAALHRVDQPATTMLSGSNAGFLQQR